MKKISLILILGVLIIGFFLFNSFDDPLDKDDKEYKKDNMELQIMGLKNLNIDTSETEKFFEIWGK